VRERDVVIVSLSGGVGNQLFQYAAGRTIAAERNARLEVVAPTLATSRSLTIRSLLDVPKARLSSFERALCGIPGGYLEGTPAPLRQPLKRGLRRLARYRQLRQSLSQMGDRRDALDDGVRYLHLRGFFQHRSYYEPVLPKLVSEMIEKTSGSFDVDSGTHVVAMHFRRGDYVMYGYALPFSFHEHALAMIAAKHDVSKVLVMSDDAEFATLAAEHLERATSLRCLPAVGSSDADDFRALACAQHVVMSNSTFVWWATVLGDRLHTANRSVICPAPWIPQAGGENAPLAGLDLSRPAWTLHPYCD
jgi:hypothetical protein